MAHKNELDWRIRMRGKEYNMSFTPNQAFRAEIKALDEHGWPDSYRIDLATDAWQFYRAGTIDWAILFARDCGTHLILGDSGPDTMPPGDGVRFVINVLTNWPESKVFQLVDGEREDDEPYFKRIR